MPVSKRTRYEVLRRDNHTCRYCGATAPDAKIGIDHVVPVSLGGLDDPANLVAACPDCNAGKSSASPDASLVADVSQDALRWAAAMKLAAERVTARDEPLLSYMAAFEDVLAEYEALSASTNYYKFERPITWRESVDQFCRAGLPVERLSHALHIAMSKDGIDYYNKWRYMCGVAWKMVAEIQAEAKLILEQGEAI